MNIKQFVEKYQTAIINNDTNECVNALREYTYKLTDKVTLGIDFLSDELIVTIYDHHGHNKWFTIQQSLNEFKYCEDEGDIAYNIARGIMNVGSAIGIFVGDF